MGKKLAQYSTKNSHFYQSKVAVNSTIFHPFFRAAQNDFFCSKGGTTASMNE
jgi:hypothetical protein